MEKKRETQVHRRSGEIISDSFFFWIAMAIMGYSLMVPLLALESLFLAESLLEFAWLHQFAIIAFAAMKSLDLFCEFITRGWQPVLLLTLSALGLLLASVQPSGHCCTSLVASIAGMASWAEIQAHEALLHVAPMLGCVAIVLEPHCAELKFLWSPTRSVRQRPS